MSAVVTCPDHPGLVNDPGHFINLIDSRCVPYTTVQLFLFAGGCFLWVVAYGILIRNALKYKYMEMAAIAVCSNFAWEFTWSFLFKTDKYVTHNASVEYKGDKWSIIAGVRNFTDETPPPISAGAPTRFTRPTPRTGHDSSPTPRRR